MHSSNPEARLSVPTLEVHHLGVVFPDENGGLHALDGVSFRIQPGEFACVLGPSGSGKSTLLRILAGLLPPSRGEVCYLGRPLNGPQPGIGIVFQKANLMPWRTVLENITLPLEINHIPHNQAEAQAQALIELVGLEGFDHTLPRDLSGGMAQRVAIARALVQDPALLLLDEPFGSLDALTRERMGFELLRIWEQRQKTVMMVTHSISEALLLADRVLVLSQRPGRLVLDLPVMFGRPRTDAVRYTAEFGNMVSQIRDAIE